MINLEEYTLYFHNMIQEWEDFDKRIFRNNVVEGDLYSTRCVYAEEINAETQAAIDEYVRYCKKLIKVLEHNRKNFFDISSNILSNTRHSRSSRIEGLMVNYDCTIG